MGIYNYPRAINHGNEKSQFLDVVPFWNAPLYQQGISQLAMVMVISIFHLSSKSPPQLTIAALGTLGDVETWSDTEAVSAVSFFGFRSNETPTGGLKKRRFSRWKMAISWENWHENLRLHPRRMGILLGFYEILILSMSKKEHFVIETQNLRSST